MTVYLIDHVLVALIALVMPVVDFFTLRKRAALILGGRTELRRKLYQSIIREEWVGTIAVVAAWFALGRGATQLGLVPRFDGLAWAGYLLTLAVCGGLLLQARSILRSPDQQARYREQVGWLSFLSPHTEKELKTFNILSVTASICEEIVFRGFLTAYAMAVLDIPLWAALVLSSVTFGLAHMYQGPLGILRTGLVGGVMSLLYAMSGSLWAPMLAHAVLDMTSGRTSFAAFRDHKPRDDSPGIAA